MTNYYHQFELLKVPEDFDLQFLEKFIDAFFKRQDALRLRYKFDEASKSWKAYYRKLDENMLGQSLVHRMLSGEEGGNYEKYLSVERENLESQIDLKNGPLFKAGFFESSDKTLSRLLLVFHHLAVDSISWQIIIDDLSMSFLQWREAKKITLRGKSSSYQDWAKALFAYSKTENLISQKYYWLDKLSLPRPPLPGLTVDAGSKSSGAARVHPVKLGKDKAELLISQVNGKYRTATSDLLLTGLCLAFDEWTGSKVLGIEVEGQGRDSFFCDLDVRETVGRFATVYPVILQLPESEKDGLAAERLESAIRSVKEQIRAIPDGGLGYGLLKHYVRDAEILKAASSSKIPIFFNYEENRRPRIMPDSCFEKADEVIWSQIGQQGKRGNALRINAFVDESGLTIEFIYDELQIDKAEIEKFSQYFSACLEGIVAHYQRDTSSKYSASDFPLVGTITQAEVDEILTAYPALVDIVPATSIQAGMLFHTISDINPLAYINIVNMVYKGDFCAASYKRAWETLVLRHPVLRTGFLLHDSCIYLQVIVSYIEIEWIEKDWSALSLSEQNNALAAFLNSDLERSFDIARPGLFRLSLINLGNERVRLIFTYHHALLDGWSQFSLLEELEDVYESYKVGKEVETREVCGFENYVAWLAERNGGKSAAVAFWRQELNRLEWPVELNLRKSVSRADNDHNLEEIYIFSSEESDFLKQSASSSQTTLNVLFQSGLILLLHKYADRLTVNFDATITLRPDDPSIIGDALGLFINTIPVVHTVNPNITVSEWLREVAKCQISRLEQGFLSLPEIRNCGDSKHDSSFFNILYVFENNPGVEKWTGEGSSDSGALQSSDKEGVGKTSYELTFTVISRQSIFVSIAFNPAQYAQEDMHILLESYKNIVLGISRELHGKVGDIESISCVERDLLSAWNHNEVSYPAGKCIHEFFECQVQKAPDNKALVFGSRVLSYGEVNDRANQLAHCLIAMGVKPNSLVGICVERSPEMVIGVLGILKAGGTYVPLDLHAPPQRLAYILHDLSVRILITQRNLLNCFETYKSRLILLDGREFTVDGESLRRYPADNIPKSSLPLGMDDAAYVLYTSGSTGLPKGVVVNHGGLTNYLCHAFGYLEIGVSATIVSSPLVFDATITPLFAGICSGRYTRLLPEENVLDQLIAYVSSSEDAYLIGVTPSHLQAWARMGEISTVPDARHVIIVGGEQLTAQILEKWKLNWLPNVHFINQFGPTETVVGCSDHEVLVSDVAAGAAIPIGKPVANSRLYVMDKGMKQRHVGVAGELYVGGHGVSRGYLNQVKLTAERYVSNPLSDFPDERLYKTGDLVRWNREGKLEFVGRVDDQVKLRGFRIEPGEIESRVRAGGLARDCVVVVREEEGERSLVAYVIPAQEDATEEAHRQSYLHALRESLLSHLPDYMVPTAFVLLESFPLSLNGKVDRQALPSPGAGSVVHSDYVAPQTDSEILLCELWEEVLGLERVGVEDNFFALGGDSILSILVASRSKARGVAVSIRQLFEYPTIRELARHVDSGSGPTFSQAAVTGEQLLLPIHREYFAAPLVDIDYYHQSQLLHVPEDFVYGFLEAFLAQVFRRHDAFRLRYRLEDGEWRAFYAPYSEDMVAQAVERVSLEGADETDRARQLEALGTEVKRRLNIERGPLFKAVYFESAQRGASRLLLVGHHLVIDGVSWRILLTDLGEAYGQWRRGEGLVLGAKTTSYQAWGERLQAYGESEALQGEREYWKGQLSQALQALPVDHEEVEDRSHGATRAVEFALDEDETRALLSESHGPYRTRIVELLLSGLLLGFYRWTGDRSLRVMMEGHGRESLFEDVDLSQTVGWFTSVYPLQLELPAGVELGDELSLGGLIKGVKESVRGIPHNGIGYGVLRHLCGDGELAGLEAGAGSTVVFNYLGQFDQQLGREELFTGAEEATGSDVGPRRECNYQLEFNGGVYNGRLRFVLDYNGGQYERETMERLLSYFADGLRSVIGHCRLSGVGGYTVSDFPLVNHVSQAELDKWQRDYPALEDLYPATGMQMGLIFHSLMDGGEGSYVNQTGWLINGLDVESYKRAWAYVISRHAVLRTAFVRLDSEEPLQLVMSHIELLWHEEDFRDKDGADKTALFDRYHRKEKARGFDFRRPSLLRLALFRENEKDYRFLLTTHHCIIDGWSMPIMFNEVRRAYQAFSNGEDPGLGPAPAYKDYLKWLLGFDKHAAKHYWSNHLADFKECLNLGIETGKGNVYELQTHTEYLILDEEETEKLKKVSQDHGVTMNTVMQALWGYLLYRYSGTREVVFGQAVSGRFNAIEKIEGMVGLFINIIPIKIEIAPEQSMGEWLKNINASLFENELYSFLGLSEIQKLVPSSPTRALFDSLLVFDNYPAYLEDGNSSLYEARQLKYREVLSVEESHYALNMMAVLDSSLKFELKYKRSQFSGGDIKKLLACLHTLIGSLTNGSALFVKDLEIIPDEIRERLNSWNEARRQLANRQPVHRLFEEQVERTPDATAIVCGSKTLSYHELNRRSNRLAHCLISLGVKPNGLVGICVERSLEMVIGILGVHKAGAAYVPLDMHAPSERLAYILNDLSVTVLITQSNLLDRFDRYSDQLVLLNNGEFSVDGGPLNGYPEENIPASVLPLAEDDAAYVLYTSGSTGLPKGVVVSHEGLTNYLSHAFGYLEAGVSATIVSSPLVFDATITTLFTGICSGRYTELLPEKNTLELLLDCLSDDAESYLFKITPAHLQTLATMKEFATTPEARHIVVVGGEQLTAPTLKSWMLKWFPNCRFINEFGPTETVVGCSTHEATVADIEAGGAIPIGKPIINTQLYVLGNHMKLQPIGAVGELYIGGGGVSRGYLNQLKLTSERFVRDPFSDAVDARLYKTGDLVRWHDDGNLEFIGRADDQVKLRGFRIELGEIESHLQSSGLVRECVVLVRHDEGEERALVAYVVPVSESGLTEEGRPGYLSSLREYLKTYLPDYMIPSAFVVLSAFPLTPNGKVDRKALPRPGSDAVVRVDYTAPETEAERQLCALWEEVLGLERVGVEDNFFALGGDSILSIQIASRSRARGVGISIRQLFEYPTIRELARHVDSGSGPTFSQAAVTGEQLLLPIHREYFAAPLVDIDYYHQSQLLHVPEDFVYGFLEAFLAQVFRRHDAFRLRYRLEDGEWRAFYAPYSEDMVAQAVERVSLEGADETDRARQLEALGTEVKRRLNIERGPLFKAVYFESAQRGASRLLLVGHHLVIDGVSWRILLTDLGEAYGQWRRGEGLVLGAKTTSYQAWGERLQAYGESEALQGEREYWKGQLSQALQALPVDHEEVEDRSHGATRAVEFALDEDETRALLSESHGPYRTRIVELLLSGLLLGFYRWTGDRSLRVMMEGHGRESLFEDVDLSQTVGWFTSVYPLQLELPAGVELGDELSLGGLIKGVKESVRGIPHNGIGYGVLRHLCGDGELAGLEAGAGSTVVFNYLGQFDQQLGREELFTGAEEATGSDVGPRRECNYQLEFNGGVYNGRLRFVLDYNGGQYERETMERLLSYFADGLRSVIGHCRLSGVGGYTVSDFPLVNHVSQAELDKWQRDYPALEDLYPATGMQMGLIFHSLMDGGEGAYINQSAMVMRNLNVEAYKQAWESVISRHAAYRTAFVRLDSDEPLQLVTSQTELPWHEEDLRGLDETNQAEYFERYRCADKARGFDFSQPPFVRLSLFREKNDSHRLLWTTHHSITDGWSTSIIKEELINAYKYYKNGERPVFADEAPYKEYIKWLKYRDTESSKRYWKQLLKNFYKATEIPKYSAIQKEPKTVITEHTVVTEQTTRDILEAARRYEVTVNVLIKAAWAYILNLYTTDERVIFGETVSGRYCEVKDIGTMVGIFINTVPVTVTVDKETDIKDWLKTIHKQQVESENHGHLSLMEILGEAETNDKFSKKLINSLVSYENYPEKDSPGSKQIIELETDEVLDSSTTFEFTLIASPAACINVLLEYQGNEFTVEFIRALLHNFTLVLTDLCDFGKKKIKDINFLVGQPAKGKCIRENDAHKAGIEDIIRAFETIVEENKQKIALDCLGKTVSYADLNTRVNQLAGYFLEKDIGRGNVVAIYSDRSIEMMIALLAVWKAGAAYLPIDINYPSRRVESILKDSRPDMILTHSSMLENAFLSDFSLFILEEPYFENLLNSYGSENRGVERRGDDPAYIIYTSGTTGQPQGIAIKHSGLINYLKHAKAEYLNNDKEKIECAVVSSSISFDATITTLFTPLLAGGEVKILPEENLFNNLCETILESKSPLLFKITPAHLQVLEGLIENNRSSRVAHVMVIGGEQLYYKQVHGWLLDILPNAVFYNEYGPTETVVGCIFYKFDRELLENQNIKGSIPIGNVIRGTTVYVCDSAMNTLPDGAQGELVIAGEGLGLGYINNAKLTHEKFVSNLFSARYATAYRSGDLVKRNQDGNYEFLQRMDEQINIRGYRVNLREIERCLSRFEGIDTTTVGVSENSLVAYVVPNSTTAYPVRKLAALIESGAHEEMGLEELPDGKLIACMSSQEARISHQKIFQDNAYHLNRIILPEDPCVVDVGANVGQFSLLIREKFPKATIYALEPVREIFSRLKFNAELYALNLNLMNLGLSSRRETGTIFFYPNFTLMSGRYQDVEVDKDKILDYFRAMEESVLVKGLDEVSLLDELENEKMEFENVDCELITLSNFIRENAIDKIDLLKISSSRSELDILKGIRQQDWLKINQIVIEVHEEGSQAQEIRKLLIENGYEIAANEFKKRSGYLVIFAVNKQYKPGERLGIGAPGQGMYKWYSTNRYLRDIKGYLSEYLPEIMVPTKYVVLDKMPLTSNGKVDKSKLERFGEALVIKEKYKAPETETERELSKLWSILLRQENIGVHDDFFALGGHSLLATRMNLYIKNHFDVEVGLRLIFENPTIELMAKVIDFLIVENALQDTNMQGGDVIDEFRL